MRQPPLPAHRLRRKPGFFHPVFLKSRHDGWTVDRQCGFLAYLYLTGSVSAAAERVGMSRESAYRLRARVGAQGFAVQWDRVLAPPGTGHVPRDFGAEPKVTLRELERRVETGFVAPVIHLGRVVGIRLKPDNTALLRLLRRTEATARRYRAGGSEW